MSFIERENPARPREVVGRVSVGDAGAAVERADRAHRAWNALPLDERIARIDAGLGAVDVDALAETLCRELGKVLADCRAEIAFSITFIRDACDRARALLVARSVDDEQGRLEIRRVPYGVVVAIAPWNAPVVLASLKVGPALACGNTVVLKPSPIAPLAVTAFMQTLARALPDGVLQVVNGGGDVGSALTSHPLVRKVAFTGGLAVGRAVAASAGSIPAPVVLELGGNDAAIFLDDADLSPAAMERAVFGTFLTGGQVCMAAKRLYVHSSRAEEFVEVYRKVADEALVVGDPMEPATTVGPLATRGAVEAIEAALDRGDVIRLGRVADEQLFAEGYFARPALVLGLPDEASLVAHEQFGPAVPLLTYDDLDEVVARANATPYGLAASVWSADEERAFDVARSLEAGFTFINAHNRSGMSLRAPFGGIKASGFGREYGNEGVLEYVQTHAINLPASARGDGGARAYPS